MRLSDLKAPLYDEVEKLRQESIKDLKNAYKKEKIALVLGAGIDVPLGLPDWNRLLSMCFGMTLAMGAFSQKNYEEVHKQLQSDRMGLQREQIKGCIQALVKEGDNRIKAPISNMALENGQYFLNCMDIYKDETSLAMKNESAVSKSLYKQLIGNCLQPVYSLTEKKDGIFLSRILRACAKMVKEGKVTEVVTYNYDTLLETCLEEIEDIHDYMDHVDAESLTDSTGKINIYHVHGCIPTKVKITDKKIAKLCGKASEDIVLSENDYYEIEKYPYDWRNVVQAKLLLQNHCLFLGFSGDDYNFRRILKLQPKQKDKRTKRHYQMIALDGIWKDISREVEKIEKDNAKQQIMKQAMLNYYLDMRQRYLADYGIQPIWTTYEQLGDTLEAIMV